MSQDAVEAMLFAAHRRIVHFDADLSTARSRIEVRVDKSDSSFERAAWHSRCCQGRFLTDPDVGQITLVDLSMEPEAGKIAHLEEGLAGLDVLAFEGLFDQHRATDRRQQVNSVNVFRLLGQRCELLYTEPILNEALRRVSCHRWVSTPHRVLIFPNNVKQFGTVNCSKRLAFLDMLPDVFHVDLIYSAVIECGDNAVDIFIILKNSAKSQ